VTAEPGSTSEVTPIGTDATVTLPGAGGDGTPIVTVADTALCAVGEDIALLPATAWLCCSMVRGFVAHGSLSSAAVVSKACGRYFTTGRCQLGCVPSLSSC
jgi:hypothetical protein